MSLVLGEVDGLDCLVNTVFILHCNLGPNLPIVAERPLQTYTSTGIFGIARPTAH